MDSNNSQNDTNWMNRTSPSRRKMLSLLGTGGATLLAQPVVSKKDNNNTSTFQNQPYEVTREVVTAGEFERIYDPSVQGEEPLKQGPDGPWYFNDHTFVRDRENGTWHLIGITHPEPADPLDEKNFGHATAETLLQMPWEEQPFALTATEENTGPGESGEHHIWAPHVIFHGGTYYMFYTGGVVDEPNPHQRYKIQLATSQDLHNWERHQSNPLFEDGFDARDPNIVRIRGQWVMYYTATSTPAGGHHIVAYRTSDDLINWSEKKVAFRHPSTGTFAGPTESPFVVRRGKYWYLFICCAGGYTTTNVYRSRDPFNFNFEDNVGTINSHASEVVKDENGDWYVSSAGWSQGGVYLAPLDWKNERVTRGREIATPYYQVTVQTNPETVIPSMSVDPTGEGNYRQILDSTYRGTGPYLAVGGFGDTDRPGLTNDIVVSDNGHRLALNDIPLGDEPVTVDWTFEFNQKTFDFSYDWHVNGTTNAPVWEVAWTLDTESSTLPHVGDSENLGRESGDVPGFPKWTMAYNNDDLSLVTAYQSGSAWSEDNLFYAADHDVVWQPLWDWGGREWPQGNYEGGTWRLGASSNPADTEFANGLWESLSQE